MVYTIKDVAKLAHVSTATVSRILNNQPGYSEKTKAKVLQVIEELGYEPNAIARGLVKKRTHTIGVLFPSVSSLFSGKLLSGIESVAHAKESSVIVCHTQESGSKTMKYLHLLNEKRIDGLIFTSEVLKDEYYDYIQKMGVPLVLLATESPEFQVPYVKVSDYQASYSAARYLIEKGHTKIGMISGGDDMIAGTPRIEGFKQALKDHALLPINEENIFRGKDFGYKEGKKNFPFLLKQFSNMTALFCASDHLAMGAMSAAVEIGIKIPEDLSIIGYDNLPIAEMANPPLTTVEQPLEEMGKKAAAGLFRMLESGDEMRAEIMPHQIIERKTVQHL